MRTYSSLLTIFKSLQFSSSKYEVIMTNTRTIYFSYDPFVYNIQLKTFLRTCWIKIHIGTRQQCSFCWQIVENIYNFIAFTAFLWKSVIFITLKFLQLCGTLVMSYVQASLVFPIKTFLYIFPLHGWSVLKFSVRNNRCFNLCC